MEALKSVVKFLGRHKKKVIGIATIGGIGAYIYKKWGGTLRKLKSSYDLVTSLGGDSKTSAYHSIVKAFENNVPGHLSYLQKRLHEQFQVASLKARVTDSALSAHEKISTFEQLKTAIIADLFAMLYMGRALSLTSLVGQVIVGKQLFSLDQSDDDEQAEEEEQEKAKNDTTHETGITEDEQEDFFGQRIGQQNAKRGGIRRAVREATHSALMGLLFAQFERFEAGLLEQLVATLSPEMAHVELKQKFSRDSLADFLKNLHEKLQRTLFHRSEEIEGVSGPCHVATLFESVPDNQIQAQAQHIVHVVAERECGGAASDALLEGVRTELTGTLSYVQDVVESEYFCSLLFDSVADDFNYYLTQLGEQFDRQEKAQQPFMQVIPLVFRLREPLFLPAHSLLGRTRLQGVRWSQLNNNPSQAFPAETNPLARNLAILTQLLLVEDRAQMEQLEAHGPGDLGAGLDDLLKMFT